MRSRCQVPVYYMHIIYMAYDMYLCHKSTYITWYTDKRETERETERERERERERIRYKNKYQAILTLGQRNVCDDVIDGNLIFITLVVILSVVQRHSDFKPQIL